jgi:hypothetical protein
MIVITVELWPFGNYAARRTIATGLIVNDGTGTREVGNYTTSFLLNGPRRRWERGSKVVNFKRLRLNVWRLIQRALEEAL